jgi:hypothetical protein
VCGCKEIDVLKMKWKVLEEELDGTEQPFRVLDRRGESNLSKDFFVVCNADAAMCRTRVYG